jgi:hypothetical protein
MPDEFMHLGKFLDAMELSKLRHPLHASLLFSPLYLLTSRKILQNHWDYTHMLQVSHTYKATVTDLFQLSKAFGNEKPDILHHIELSLWRMLFQVATDQETIFAVLSKFFAEIPQDNLLALPEGDHQFYYTGMLVRIYVQMGSLIPLRLRSTSAEIAPDNLPPLCARGNISFHRLASVSYAPGCGGTSTHETLQGRLGRTAGRRISISGRG